MSEDARFEDAHEAPLYLAAQDVEDLRILATLTQDAVFPATEMQWDAEQRRFAILLNRFRWEDAKSAVPERVQSVLMISEVLDVASQAIDHTDESLVYSLLDISFTPAETAPEGYVTLILAGDGAIRCHVEALDLTLKDVTKPYFAIARERPSHDT